MPYAELHAKTNFSFLEGASHPDELVERAAELGYAALAITDRNSLAGVVRAHVAAKDTGLKLLVGAEITPEDAPPVVLLPTDRAAYGRLASLITRGRRRAEKGECSLTFADVAEMSEGILACVLTAEGVQGSGGRVRGPEFGGRVGDCEYQVIDNKSQMDRTTSRKPTPFPNPELRTPNPVSSPLSPVPFLHRYREAFGDRCYLLAELHHGPDDARHLEELIAISRRAKVPLAAAGGVQYHVPQRRALHDVLTATRLGCTVAEAGEALLPNAQRYLKSPDAMGILFARTPEAIRRTIEVAQRVQFSLDQLRYEYPEEVVLPEKVTATFCPQGPEDASHKRWLSPFPAGGATPLEYLKRLAWTGAEKRYPAGVPEKVRRLIEHELALIGELRYEAYFLTVWDLVRFARGRGILCQGRGSAANSAVCYCLGITSVDPERMDVLFERFVSRERNEAPDIDVDFEHQRREEVLQYLYEKYGRDRAGMTAEVITYRPRSAVRDVGKALGLSLGQVDALAKTIEHFHGEEEVTATSCPQGPEGVSHPRWLSPLPDRCQEAGIDPESLVGRQLIELTGQLVGFPRHLSQHTGGMVMTRGRLCELVPIENAAMPDRTVIQWNKDDLDELGILKVDCLALGMLSAIHRCFDLIAEHNADQGAALRGQETRLGGRAEQGTMENENCPTRNEPSDFRRVDFRVVAPKSKPPNPPPLSLADIPPEDPAVYAMIRRADTMGVFQIESRAQMSMLPRLKPRCFYDLVIEVAIVRPGPIQGDMVHPYLRRRNGEEAVTYPSPAIREVLEKTLGVPLFQEQAMRLAVVAAGFTPGEADQLRRAMGAWRRPGVIDQFRKKLIDGMRAHGLAPEYAEAVFRQIRGFGEYGFPESHAASFALLVYVSAWLKCHHPAAFTASLLNSQPMGFYGPAQLVRNAREHGVEVRAVDVNHSRWDCTLEGNIEYRRSNIKYHIEEEPTCQTEDHSRDASGNVEDAVLPSSLSPSHSPALRLGLRTVHGFSETHADQIEAARAAGRFRSVDDFARRTGLSRAVIVRLAKAGAFDSLGLDRRGAMWHALAQGTKQEQLPLFDDEEDRNLQSDISASLPPMSPAQEVLADYRATGLSLRAHPMSFLRTGLGAMDVVPSKRLATWPNGKPVRVAGVVLVRQRPGTAKGITFVTLEDETGVANLIIRPDVWKKFRAAALGATVLLAHGRLQREGLVIHVLVSRLEDLSARMQDLTSQSRDFS